MILEDLLKAKTLPNEIELLLQSVKKDSIKNSQKIIKQEKNSNS